MAKDWSKLYKKYKGMWIALAKNESTVLGFGKTASEALKKSQKKTSKTPTLVYMPKDLKSFVGIF